MQITITSVDYAPDDLYDQVPLVVELLRELPGPDRPDYWIGELETPVTWIDENIPRQVSHVVLCARWEGTEIARGMENLPLGIAYVTEAQLLKEASVDFERCRYVAIGIGHDTGGDAPIKRQKGVLAGTIGRLFGLGNQD